ncbi:pirin-like C-terminal cupin domain-containing protein [Mesorhizobium sp. M0701]|uniref:pirin-like C-terminal cupin domain-containing protein n=1 Tax=Mesorhizobium sp. M0701 TaxID=2956989 RepID=UPI00333CAB12
MLQAPAFHAARLMLIGGEPLAEPRHIYWNFVSSSADRAGKGGLARTPLPRRAGRARTHASAGWQHVRDKAADGDLSAATA